MIERPRMDGQRWGFVLFLCAFWLPVIPATASFEALRLKWRDIILPQNGIDTNDAGYQAWVTTSLNAAQNHDGTLLTNGGRLSLWADLNGLSTNSSHISSSFHRLRAMALGYAIPGTALHRNAALFQRTTNALDWLCVHYYTGSNVIYDNWFDWEIASALSLNDITVLLYDDLTAQQRGTYMNAVYGYTPAPAYTAANKVWKASVVAVRGVLTQTETNVAAARDALSDVFPYVNSGEGFYREGSFIFHDYFPYNGHYGAKLIETVGPLMQLLKGSPWEVTDPAQTNLFRWICESFEPLLYDGAMMQMVSGRAYSRTGDDHADGHDVIASILRIAQFAAPAEAARYRSMVKHWLLADRHTDFIAARPVPYNLWARQVRDDPNIVARGPLLGNYLFPRMERVTHFRPGWALGVAMSSKRIANYEALRGENLKGWYTGDGMTYLYNADQGHYADHFWPTVNPYRLPGTTVDSQIRTNGSGEGYRSPNLWSGGVTLPPTQGEMNGRQEYGVAGMILRAWNSSLTARKSWFMFDDEVVCLGAGITASDGRRVETIVENRNLAGHGNNALTVNGVAKAPLVGWSETMTNASWIHLEGNVPNSDIGYYFPAGTTVKGLREARGGSLFDGNNKFGATNQHSRNFLALWLDHGIDPSAATYRYVLLPGKTPEQMAAYAAKPHITVLRNNSDAHAVQETTLGITAVNFWRDMSNRIASIYTDRRSSVMAREDGVLLDIALADPIHTNTGVMNFEYSAPATAALEVDPAITILQLQPVIKGRIDLTDANGRSFRARFYMGGVESFTNNPVADAYVQNGDQSVSNFGTSATLALKSSATILAREAFLRFQVPQLPGLLADATLRLMPVTVNDPVLQHGLGFVPDNSWTETGITWDNKPSSEGPFTTWLLPRVGTPALIGITDLAQRALEGEGNLSLRLYSTGTPPPTNGFAAYASRENTASSRPQLWTRFGQVQPLVRIDAPGPDSAFNAPATITITGAAQDFDGSITNVDLFSGAFRLARGSPAPPSQPGVPGTFSAALTNLAAGHYTFTAVATDNSGLSATSAPVTVRVSSPAPGGTGTGLVGEYFGTENFTTPLLTRTDASIDFDWGSGSPGGAVPNNRFSVRWAGKLQARRSGAHTFHLTSDNGARLWLDGQVVIDHFASHNLAEKSGAISLEAGQYYNLLLEYYDLTGPASVQLAWEEPGRAREVVPPSQFYPVWSGLIATYHAGTNLNNAVFTRLDPVVNFNWGTASPEAVLLPDSFSVRWTGKVRAQVSGVHSFYTTSDDGVRLRIGTQTIINNWTVHTATQNTGTVSLVAGQYYDVSLEYFDASGPATMVLMWAPPGQPRQLLSSESLTPYAYNQPPSLEAPDFLRVTRGANASVLAIATDLDVPPQTLAFSLDAGAPAWAVLHPNSGALSLGPPISAARGMYTLGVRVTDNGVPPLSAARSLGVLVTDDIVAPVTLIATGSVWRYFDGGVDQGTFWRGVYFDDGGWARGPAPLGYRTGSEATTVSYGPSSSNKYPTTYFRRPFFVPDISAVQSLALRVLANDGLVLYVNGSEVLRDNLPSSPIAYTNYATRRINGDTNILVRSLSTELLFDGINLLAAEIHQNAANGSDILFDLELSGLAFVPGDAPLQIVPNGQGLSLVWPAQAGLLSLHAAPNLAAPVVWRPLDLFGESTLQVSGPYCLFELVAPTNQAWFFRLQSP